MLSIRLLGTPQLLRDDQPLSVTRKKSRALLYYLAAQAKPLTRDHLLAFFWPDHDRAAAQQTLRTTLHGLRKELGAALIVADETISLAPDTDVDVRTFEAQLQHPAAEPQSLSATLELYHGDFLTDFALADTPDFDDWVVAQQEHYRRLAVRGYIALANWYESQQAYGAALESLDHALEFDPLQEDLQRTALRLHYQSGDRAGAIRRYENLRKLLDDEMGVPPMAETRALYDAIINDKLPAGQHSAFSIQHSALSIRQSAINNRQHLHRTQVQVSAIALPFIGRDQELQQLNEAATARKLALIEGEPGIGKTRLAEKFILAYHGLALIGAAHELEHALPYQPIFEALRDLATRPAWPALQTNLRAALPGVWQNEIARFIPELISSSPPHAAAAEAADESRLWEGLHQLLLVLARQRPVVFFLDDVQWADTSTLALLGYLVRAARAAGAPIAYLAAARPVDVRSTLAALLQTLTRESRLTRLPLDRLRPDDLNTLAHQLSPSFAFPLADWLIQNSEGNPYILSELIQYARENNLLLPDGVVNLSAISTSPIVPQSIYSLIQARLARLSESARRILDAAVAAGRVFEFEVVAHAAALSENAALDALDELRAARLIEPTGAEGLHYSIDHNLTMEVAYREVGEPRHRLMHRRVAEAMETLYRQRHDEVAGLIAWHFIEGHAPDRAAPYAFRAGKIAMDLAAWTEAVTFYQQALAAETNNPQRVEILTALGEAHFRAGQNAQATEVLRTAIGLAEPHHLPSDEIRLALVQSLLSQARFAEAVEQARWAHDHGRPENIARAEALWGTILAVEGSDLTSAAEHLQKAETFMQEHQDQIDPALLSQVKFDQGSIAAQQGDLATAISLYRETLDIAAEAGDAAVQWQVLARNNLAYHLNLSGDSSAVEYAHEGLKLAQEKGILGFQPYLLSTLGEIALSHRDLGAAEKYFNDGLELAERLAAPERIAGITANLGLVAKERGDTALAIHHLSTALAKADALGVQHLAAQIRLWLVPLLPTGEARLHLTEARAIAQSSGRRLLLDEVVRLEQQLGSHS